MGFLANAWNYGWTAGSIITKAEKDADRICSHIKKTIIPDPDDGEYDEDDYEDPGCCQVLFHPDIFASLMGFDLPKEQSSPIVLQEGRPAKRRAAKESESSILSVAPVEDIGQKPGADSGNGETCTPEVIESMFDSLDMKRNIAAAVNHFGIGNDGDIDIIRTQIAAVFYIAGLADTDAVFEALNKDSTEYAAVNERVRMYTGEPMDERLIKMDIDKDIDDAVLEKLKLLTDWELEYLTERMGYVHEDDLSGTITEAHMKIMNHLDMQTKRHEDMAEVITAGYDGSQ